MTSSPHRLPDAPEPVERVLAEPERVLSQLVLAMRMTEETLRDEAEAALAERGDDRGAISEAFDKAAVADGVRVARKAVRRTVDEARAKRSQLRNQLRGQLDEILGPHLGERERSSVIAKVMELL